MFYSAPGAGFPTFAVFLGVKEGEKETAVRRGRMGHINSSGDVPRRIIKRIIKFTSELAIRIRLRVKIIPVRSVLYQG